MNRFPDRIAAVLGLSLLGGLPTGCAEPAVEPFPFEPFEYVTVEPDVLTDRLCPEAAADPHGVDDVIFIDCAVEGADLRTSTPEPREELVVMAYNVERGLELDGQLAWLTSGEAPRIDVLLVSEADRGCSRVDGRHVTWELAEALDMAFVYAVEFLELPRDSGIDAPCEHGNAILSRYDLGNVEAIRHEANRSWYIPEEELDGSGEPRLGGRIAIKADIRVGEQIVHLYSLHFESHPSDGEYRDAQAVELAEHGLDQPFRVVQGGDSNAPAYWLDLANGSAVDDTTQAWLTRGYVDTHEALRPEDRATTDLGVVIDVMFTTSAGATDPRVCAVGSACDGLSDHLPIWATVPVAP